MLTSCNCPRRWTSTMYFTSQGYRRPPQTQCPDKYRLPVLLSKSVEMRLTKSKRFTIQSAPEAVSGISSSGLVMMHRLGSRPPMSITPKNDENLSTAFIPTNLAQERNVGLAELSLLTRELMSRSCQALPNQVMSGQLIAPVSF